MSRTLVFALNIALVFFLLAGNLAAAPEIQLEGTAARQAQRGFLNIAMSPFEFANQLSKVKTDDRTVIPSWILALNKGAFMTVSRALVGTYEIVTLPFPINGRKPALHPEFVWQD